MMVTEPVAPHASPGTPLVVDANLAARLAASPIRNLRIALVHDWLTGMRGGERVLEAICELVPQAALYTLVHVPGRVSPTIERHAPITSFVQRLPRAARWYRYYLPLFPWAIEELELSGFDLVISSSHCVAKSVIAPAGARHLCYCHTPMRYAWDMFESYFGERRVGAASHLARPILRRLARWDAATSDRPDRYLANSQYVAQRIDRYYNRPAHIVHPPVETTFYTPLETRDGSPEPYALIVSALVPYKRVDVAIAAATRVQMPLIIVGEGPERARLEASAGPGVTFLGRVPDTDVRDLYRRATAILVPWEEDFGIVPVEAHACGRPVVALGRGGVLDSVQDGVNGLLVADDSEAAWVDALDRVRRAPFDPTAIRATAERFARPRFQSQILDEIEALVTAPEDQARW
jgi:glycosyltransferase involved in cell wall biosynthesis